MLPNPGIITKCRINLLMRRFWRAIFGAPPLTNSSSFVYGRPLLMLGTLRWARVGMTKSEAAAGVNPTANSSGASCAR
ncbi:MAG: hypothetical protein AVDCRST_MAG02-498 [uncultured Rubrobacteraceae bacterium]|uniref:Uncharacterized protein n=1 Tax=uncultured Rubrobacteraceae bacterium TaxID=349277 RepID=A0A6J4QTQ6_9ACTN|nr:MAG: hypothetical protein AVDCRST_MAG02-498 [uncultured Rubrobacteraceae bacterium]